MDFAVLWGGESEGWALVEQVPVLVRNLFTAGEVRSSPSVIGAWIRVWALQSVGTPGRRRTTRGGARRAAACGPSAGRGARTPRPIPCTDRGVRTPVSAGGGRAHALLGSPRPMSRAVASYGSSPAGRSSIESNDSSSITYGRLRELSQATGESVVDTVAVCAFSAALGTAGAPPPPPFSGPSAPQPKPSRVEAAGRSDLATAAAASASRRRKSSNEGKGTAVASSTSAASGEKDSTGATTGGATGSGAATGT